MSSVAAGCCDGAAHSEAVTGCDTHLHWRALLGFPPGIIPTSFSPASKILELIRLLGECFRYRYPKFQK